MESVPKLQGRQSTLRTFQDEEDVEPWRQVWAGQSPVCQAAWERLRPQRPTCCANLVALTQAEPSATAGEGWWGGSWRCNPRGAGQRPCSTVLPMPP